MRNQFVSRYLRVCSLSGLLFGVGCSSESPTSFGACGEGQVERAGRCVSDEDLQYCVDLINAYRAKLRKSALNRSTELEEFAAKGVVYDAERNSSHAHFRSEKKKPADAENEIPGWPLSRHGSVRAIIEAGTKMMWNEGPGGGHYENIIGNHTTVGCGTYVTDEGDVWVIQDFK